MSRNEILDKLRQFNAENGLKHVNELPYLYAIPKMHKNPHSLRFIAGVHGQKSPFQRNEESEIAKTHKRKPIASACATTAASKVLCKELDRKSVV